MFHSICPECGRVIVSTARECPNCDGPSSAEGTPAANGVDAAPLLGLPIFGALEDVDPFEAMVAMVDSQKAPELPRAGHVPIWSGMPFAPAPYQTVGTVAGEAGRIDSDLSKHSARNLIQGQLLLPVHLPDGVSIPGEMQTGQPVAVPVPQGPGGKIKFHRRTEPMAPSWVDRCVKPGTANRAASLTETPSEIPSENPVTLPPLAEKTEAPDASRPPARRPYKLRRIAVAAKAVNVDTPAAEVTPPESKTPELKTPATPAFTTGMVALPFTATAVPSRFPVTSEALEVRFKGLTALPPAPKNTVRHMPYGWLASYTAAAHRQMRPASQDKYSQDKTGQRKAPAADFGFTTPSPVLTPNLISFHKNELRTVFPGRLAKGGARGWPVWFWATVILGTVLGAGVANVFSGPVAPPAARPTAAASSSTPAAAAAGGAPYSFNVPSNSLAKSIEVTGFRLGNNSNSKPEIQYVVVSHSSARLSGLNVYVTLQDANALPGQAPLCQFSFVTPDLDPYEAKQMSNPIEGTHKTTTLPDWQNLKVDVQVGQ